MLRSLALSLSQLVLKAALKPLTKRSAARCRACSAAALGFAKGGVLQQRHAGAVRGRRRHRRARSTFPLAGGRMGLAGERGAEAIMPLARGPDGRLGVAAQAAAAAST